MAKHVITGGPGSGKTTLVKKLAALGHSIVPETARDIIAREQRRESLDTAYRGIVPWRNLALFQELYLAQQLGQEEMLDPQKTYFLDRALADPIAYAEWKSISPPSGIETFVREAGYDCVFHLETVPRGIYENDPERKETYAEAQDLSNRLYGAYARFGFKMVRLPFVEGIDARVGLLLGELGA